MTSTKKLIKKITETFMGVKGFLVTHKNKDGKITPMVFREEDLQLCYVSRKRNEDGTIKYFFYKPEEVKRCLCDADVVRTFYQDEKYPEVNVFAHLHKD